MEKSTPEQWHSGTDRVESDQTSPRGLPELIVSHSPDPAMLVDGDGVLVTGNERLATLLDRPSDDIDGQPLTALFPDLSMGAVERHCREAAVGEYVTTRGSRGAGDLWVELAFNCHQWDDQRLYLGTVHDVTARHDRETRLEGYERIVETISDGVFTLDDALEIETVNEATARMTGYAREELVGANAALLADASTLDRATELSSEILAGEREVATLTTTIRTDDGETLPVETRFSAYTDDEGSRRQVGVVRDISDRRQFARTLTELHESTRKLIDVKTVDGIESCVVSAATEVLELPAAGIYRLDCEDNELQRTTSAGPVSDIEGSTVGPDDGPLWDAYVHNERRQVGLDGRLAGETTDEGVVIPLDSHGVFVVATEQAGDRYTRKLVDLLAASARTALARVDRETELRAKKTELDEQNERLQRLKRVNEIIRRIDRVLVEAETRGEIERAVCAELVELPEFGFAWIGRPDGQQIAPKAWSGTGSDYLDDISLSTADDGGPPAVRSIRSESLTVETTIADGLRAEPWRTAALTRGFQSAISVPLSHDGFVYGVLTVYADDQSALGEVVQSVIAELADTIANGLREIASRQPRRTDGAVELRFTTEQPADPMSRLAERLDADVTCTGIVPKAAETTGQFLRIPDTDLAAVERGVADLARVESVQRVTDDEKSGLYEVVVIGPTLPRTLVAQGARLTCVRATGAELDATVVVAANTDIREFVERLQRHYPDTRLTARTERSQEVPTVRSARTTLADRLTDRQFEVLRTAHLSGFYEWPRETTGESLADMLDIAQSTASRHRRVGERTLLDIVFGGD